MARKGALILALAALAALLVSWWEPDGSRDTAARTARGADRNLGDEGTRFVQVPEPETASTEPAVPEGKSAIEGVVSGKYGPIWGVEVFARIGDETVAEASTDTDGRYRLDLDPGDYELVARPAGETGLEARSKPVRADEGFASREDFSFGTGRDLEGRVVDANGEGVANVQVVAVPADAVAKTPAGVRADLSLFRHVPKEAATSDMAGTFRIRGLDANGSFVLMIRSEQWTHVEAVPVTPQSDGVVVVASSETRVRIGARDADLGWPVRQFRVTVRFADGAVFLLDGMYGACWGAVPHDPRGAVTVSVDAPGYAPVTTDRVSTSVELRLLKRDNILFRFRTADGASIREPVLFEVRFRGRIYDVSTLRPDNGTFRATLPPGTWNVRVRRRVDTLGVAKELVLEVPEHGGLDRDVEFPATTRLVLRRPRDWRWPNAWVQVVGLDGKGRRAYAWLRKTEELVYDHVVPGRYRIEVRFDGLRQWPTDVKAFAGETVTVEIPDGP